MKKQIDILLVTYNQEQYIQQALDGIFIQRLENDIKMRIIVADDCSTDGTLDIIKKYSLEHSADWLFLPSDQNLGIAKNYKRAIAATTADDVAILEGDDYWTDANRLQKHIDYLSTHTDCVMTKNNYFEYNQMQNEWRLVTSPRQYILLRNNINEYMLGNLSCSVFRGDVLRNVDARVYEFGEKQRHEATDYYLTLGVLQAGYGYVLDETMSVYRISTGGNISLRDMTGKEQIDKAYLCYKQTYEMLGENYKNECYKFYLDTIKWVTEYNHAEKEKAWAEHCPPFFAHLVWVWMPKCWWWIKAAIRACIPNALHRRIKIKE